MHKRVRWGCACIPMVYIHGCEWVWGDIIEAWRTGKRQSELRMTVISRVCTPEQSKDNKKQDLKKCNNNYHKKTNLINKNTTIKQKNTTAMNTKIKKNTTIKNPNPNKIQQQ